MICEKCGYEISEKAEYCVNCGNKIKKIAEEDKEAKLIEKNKIKEEKTVKRNKNNNKFRQITETNFFKGIYAVVSLAIMICSIVIGKWFGFSIGLFVISIGVLFCFFYDLEEEFYRTVSFIGLTISISGIIFHFISGFWKKCLVFIVVAVFVALIVFIIIGNIEEIKSINRNKINDE